LIGRVYQTLKTVFGQISKHLEVRQKYSATRRIFNPLLSVWKCVQTLSFEFDILLGTLQFGWFSILLKVNRILYSKVISIKQSIRPTRATLYHQVITLHDVS